MPFSVPPFVRSATLPGLALLFSAAFVAAAPSRATTVAAAVPVPAPADFAVHVRLANQLSSQFAKTGDTFSFVVLDDAVVLGRRVTKCSLGNGTVVLAGHAGRKGHEGDLDLRFDSVVTDRGQTIALQNAVYQSRGHQKKTLGTIAQISPYTGFGAFVRGGEAVVAPSQAFVVRDGAVTAQDGDASATCPGVGAAPATKPAT